MTETVLTLLENSARRMPEKTAFVDENGAVCYADFARACRSIGSGLLSLEAAGRPI
ncbi:MAG TPA: D-alanine--poly(phosphoribitol) ligase, partial [Candidatus Fimivicinus intestinavium]|nr:D-alanine--poly(phosphoribitol) ligase [Candidatus Fimivicinus intestinavium]